MRIYFRNKFLIVITGHILYAFISIIYSSLVDSSEEAGFVLLTHLYWLFSTLIIFGILFFIIEVLVSKKKILPNFFKEDFFLIGLYVIIFLKIYLSGITSQVFLAYWTLLIATITLMVYVFYHFILNNKASGGFTSAIIFVLILLLLSAYIDYGAMTDVCSLDWVKSDNCRFFE